MATNENYEDLKSEDEKTTEKTPHMFLSPWHFSDVVLVVEGTKFHVHRSTLSMWSPVFEKMFTSEFSEKNVKEIPLPGKRASEVEVLLNLIYSSGTKQEVDGENLVFLLELAEEYQMEQVKELCLKCLDNSIRSLNCIRKCNLADRFGLEDLISKCMESASHLPYDRLEAVEEYKEMKPDVKLEICKKRIIELEKTLAEYIAICSKQVAQFYEAIANKNLRDVLCDRNEDHPEMNVHYTRYEQRKKFDLSCECCMRRLLRNTDCEISSLCFKEGSKKLYDLERQSKVVAQLKTGAQYRIAKRKNK